MEFLRSHEPLIRLAFFAALLGSLALLELFLPRRALATSRRKRWPANFGMLLLNTAVLRLVVPLGAVGFALWAERQHFGLLQWLRLPRWLEFCAAIVLLDLAIYAQHLLFHMVPSLWRLHRMHHSDTEVDVSTGNRFHLLEIVLSMAIKGVVVLAFGLTPVAVLVFEIVLNAGSMFSHSNIRLPGPIDRALRWLLVTPDMHRIHHSVRRPETDSNFGFNLSLWDRIFRTYRAQPADSHLDMTLGLPEFRQAADQKWHSLLLQPFRRTAPPAPGSKIPGHPKS